MVSVIVPVYNSKDYLPCCLDSIVAQSYSDLEIILVDDGSTDGSGIICDDYAHRDSRIKVIHQENGGNSNARNTGLKNVKGDSVLLIDHDDIIHPLMIETLWTLLNRGDYDFSMCFGELVYDTVLLKDKVNIRPHISHIEELSQDSCMRNLFMSSNNREIQYRFIWNKLYKRNILEDLNFADTASEDTEFNCRVFQKINKAVLTTDHLYYWIQRRGSLSHQGYNMRYVNVIDSYFDCLNDIPEINYLYRSFCLQRLYRKMLSTCYWTRGTSFHEVAVKKSKTIFKQTSIALLNNTYIPFIEKVVLIVFIYCPFLYSCYIKIKSFKAV